MSAGMDEVTRAANLIREHGYAVVTQVQADMWETWLKESHARENKLHDQVSRLVGEHGWLLDRITNELKPSRPRWLRESRSWWNRGGWREPLVFGGPDA